MNPFKYSQMIKYLTRVKKQKPDLPDVFPASQAPIPDRSEFVKTKDAINAFIRRERQQKAGGGMLVQPGFGGMRQGYREDKYVTPARRSGAEGFQGQKFISVKDPTYSDGRRRVKTPEYEEYLKKEIAKSKQRPDYQSKGFIRREPGLLRIAEAMQQADINDDAEFMMPNKQATKTQEKYFNRKMKVFKKGMLEGSDIVYINNLEKNFDDVIFIADQLGESPDWVLDKLEERTEFRDFAKGEKDILKKDPKYTKPRNDYLKVENWVQKNAKKYVNPDTFERALIRRFGKDNQFVKDMNSKKGLVQTYFSNDFKKTMLNITAEKSRSKPSHLKQFIKSSLYNFNPKIKNAVTTEIKNIFSSKNLPKLRTEARKLLDNNKLLSTFGLNKAITGPYARVIQAEIGQQLFADITNFRQHRVGTQEMLKAFEQIVADEFKPMFNETAKAIGFSKQNQWPKAKEILGLADNIAWDHKVPSSIIDKGYADIIEYTKVNPTTANFNERIKNAQFDRPINQLITKFEKATTLDAKAKIKNEMDIVKNNFSQKYGGYLDEVSINLDPQGNLKFSSSAKPLTMKDNTIAMLGKSLIQAKEGTPKEIAANLRKLGFKCKFAKADGGRIGLSTGTGRCDDPMSYVDDIKKQEDLLKVQTKKAPQAVKTLNTARKLNAVRSLFTSTLGPGALAFEAAAALPIAYMGYKGGKTPENILADSTFNLIGKSDKRVFLDKAVEMGFDTANIKRAQDLLKKQEAFEKQDARADEFMGPDDMFMYPQMVQKAERDLTDITKQFIDPKTGQVIQERVDAFDQIPLVEQGVAKDQADLAAERQEQVGNVLERPITDYLPGLAGGGIAKLAGVDSGPPPESGPNSQGLQGLFKRAMKG